jgi:hypothetical protein
MTLSTIVMSMLVAASDDEYRGRVMGLFATCSVGAIPITSLGAGALAAAFGATTTVLACGVAALVFTIGFFALGSLGVIRGRSGLDTVGA